MSTQQPKLTVHLSAWGAAAGLVAVLTVVAYAVNLPHSLRVAATGLVLAAAGTITGALVGFIFGVPRVLAEEATRTEPTARGVRSLITANTNLEQISDWLTKILVGVGLTQFRELADAAGRLFRALGPSFGGGAQGRAFAGGLLIYSCALGFVLGWLFSRLFLGQAMAQADRRAQVLDLFEQADEAAEQGDQATATALRSEARELLEQTAGISSAYESIRTHLPSGRRRTSEMDGLVNRARTMAPQLDLDGPDVAKMLREGTDGQRVTALGLMQGAPEVADLDLVIGVLEHPRSPFEQYHALRLLHQLFPTLAFEQQARVVAAVTSQRRSMGHDASRTWIADQILGASSAS
jgi:hypothetical protein